MSLKCPPADAAERCRFWVAGDVGIELLDARYLKHRFVPHTHQEYSIGVILDGVLGFRHERLDDAAPAGSVKAVNPGDLHTGFPGADRGWSYRNFFVAAEVMRQVACGLGGDGRLPELPRRAIHDPLSAAELVRLHRMLEASADPLERQSETVAVLSRFVARHARGRVLPCGVRDDRPGVARARELIEGCFGEDLSLGELAAVAGLSPYHFLRLFRRVTGLTPHAYLLQVRIDRARTMLAAGTPVAETALACGFADQSHLTRRFKGVLGVTPGRYRRASLVPGAARPSPDPLAYGSRIGPPPPKRYSPAALCATGS